MACRPGTSSLVSISGSFRRGHGSCRWHPGMHCPVHCPPASALPSSLSPADEPQETISGAREVLLRLCRLCGQREASAACWLLSSWTQGHGSIWFVFWFPKLWLSHALYAPAMLSTARAMSKLYVLPCRTEFDYFQCVIHGDFVPSTFLISSLTHAQK